LFLKFFKNSGVRGTKVMGVFLYSFFKRYKSGLLSKKHDSLGVIEGNSRGISEKFTLTSNYKILHLLNKNLKFLRALIGNSKQRFFLKTYLTTIFSVLSINPKFNQSFFFKLEGIRVNHLFYKYHVNLVFKKFKKYAIFFTSANKLQEFINIIFISFMSKDLSFFSKWLVKIFETTFYRKHKKILYLLKLFLSNYFIVYLKIFNCYGFTLKVRGKIGVGGNSKKKKSFMRVGSSGFSSKSLKFSTSKGVIKTTVGVLGFRCFIFFT